MNIVFSPQRRDDTLAIVKAGDALIINGEAFDLSGIPEGATLPADAIDSVWFCGPVSREGGELTVHLLLPHGPNPTHEQAYPEPMRPADGPLSLPRNAEPVTSLETSPEVGDGQAVD